MVPVGVGGGEGRAAVAVVVAQTSAEAFVVFMGTVVTVGTDDPVEHLIGVKSADTEDEEQQSLALIDRAFFRLSMAAPPLSILSKSRTSRDMFQKHAR